MLPDDFLLIEQSVILSLGMIMGPHLYASNLNVCDNEQIGFYEVTSLLHPFQDLNNLVIALLSLF